MKTSCCVTRAITACAIAATSLTANLVAVGDRGLIEAGARAAGVDVFTRDYDPSKTKLFDSNASQSSTDFERSKYRHFYKGNYGTNPNFTIRINANSGDVKFL